MKDLLKEMCECFGPSGKEERISAVIQRSLEGYADEIKKDVMGNLIAHKAGKGKKVMVCAHMDEIGFIITYIDDKGFARFAPVGGQRLSSILNRQVVFENGVRGVLTSGEKIKIKDLKLSDCYIDMGATSKEEAAKMVNIGDMAVLCAEFSEMGNRYVGGALDNRAGCFVMVETLKKLVSSPYDLYFVFTSQEEVGLRGAKTSAFAIEPDIALAIDVTDTGDVPDCPFMAVELGKGPAIKIRDSGIISHKWVCDWLKEGAKREEIPYQLEVLASGSSDIGAIHTTKGGVVGGAISIPCRYIHSAVECVDKSDLDNTIALLTAVLSK
jgi:endoglucanase